MTETENQEKEERSRSSFWLSSTAVSSAKSERGKSKVKLSTQHYMMKYTL